MKTVHRISKFLAIDAIPYDYDTECIRLDPHIRLRREHFGGLVYDSRNGTMLEVDKGAFQLLELIDGRALQIGDIMTSLRERKILKQPDRASGETVQRLFELHIIQKTDEAPLKQVPLPQESNENVDKPWLSAPETVHWAVTYRCDEECPDCYVARFPPVARELATGDALRLIDTIAGWGVFQLAIGGGEPFARMDLPELVSRAANRGLSIHLTTGMLDAGLMQLESLSSSIKNLQIGIKPERLLGADPEGYIRQLSRFLEHAQRLGMEPGANVFLTSSVIGRMEDLIAMLTNIGFARITLLRYKPPESIRRWMREHPDSLQMKGLHERIAAIIRGNPRMRVRVDCALGFLLRHLPCATHLRRMPCFCAGWTGRGPRLSRAIASPFDPIGQNRKEARSDQLCKETFDHFGRRIYGTLRGGAAEGRQGAECLAVRIEHDRKDRQEKEGPF